MKLIHIADVHLGMTPEKDRVWSDLRESEIKETFERVLAVCEEQKVDLLLIAGDLFHRQPLVRELREVNYQFQKLSHTKVVLIAGNHDYVGMRSNYIDFAWTENVTMLKSRDFTSISFPELRTTVTGFSYPSREITEAQYDYVKPEGEAIRILLAHGGERRYVPIDFKRLQLAGFAYVALGHIHKPQKFTDQMYYSGSLEPLDKNETGEHGYVFADITVDIAGRQVVHSQFVPFAKRKYVDLSIPVTGEDTNGSIVDRVREGIQHEGVENLYRVILTGEHEEHLAIDTAALMNAGQVTEVRDETLPEYDFESIRKANKDNLIGMYIDKLAEKEDTDPIAKKALYYGLKALLGGGK